MCSLTKTTPPSLTYFASLSACHVKQWMVSKRLCKMRGDIRLLRGIFIRLSRCVCEPWLNPCVFAGGRSHRGGSETTDAGYVSFLQQAQEQILVSLGSRHYLQEKNKSSSEHQPGVHVVSKPSIVVTRWSPFWPSGARYLHAPLSYDHFCCLSRSLPMATSQQKSLWMACLPILPRSSRYDHPMFAFVDSGV